MLPVNLKDNLLAVASYITTSLYNSFSLVILQKQCITADTCETKL